MDRETVVKCIEYCTHSEDKHCETYCPYWACEGCCIDAMLEDALALLKDQDNCENCAIAVEDRQLVVRCKDCKKRYTVLCIQEEAGNINNQDDWFCANGVKKDD